MFIAFQACPEVKKPAEAASSVMWDVAFSKVITPGITRAGFNYHGRPVAGPRVHAVVRWRAQPDFGNPRFATCSTASQNLSNSLRVVYTLGVTRPRDELRPSHIRDWRC